MTVAVGFTGTQKGLTDYQRGWLWAKLKALRAEGFQEFHHGDCIGADLEGHRMARALGYRIIRHPPLDGRKRAFTSDYDEDRRPRGYLERNRDIVMETQVLVATPAQIEPVLQSGTWATIRFAQKKGRPCFLIVPWAHRAPGPFVPSDGNETLF